LSPSKLPNIGRYILVLGAAILLAPYAGCHIVTTPPQSIRELSHGAHSADDEPFADENTTREEPRANEPLSELGANNSDKLDDIEKLLTP
jgi:hypothetical protein